MCIQACDHSIYPKLKSNVSHLFFIGYFRWGSFTNYVDMILAFFDPLPTATYIFYGMNVDKIRTFLDHLPT